MKYDTREPTAGICCLTCLSLEATYFQYLLQSSFIMKYGGAYWNIKDILPYQRNFNFINAIRDIGKTYTTLGFFLDRFLAKREQHMYIVRTQDEKKNGAYQQAFEKVLSREFPEYEFKFTPDTMLLDGEVVGHCRALSETIKVKKQSFPHVKWGVMDEYMLEPKYFDVYVKGWYEPNLLLNLYHTVDREEDRFILFLLGNNTAFYNPYHLHDAFLIPPCRPGQIWKSKNTLFQWAVPSDEKIKMQSKSKFAEMVKNTDYGKYAIGGEYLGDNNDFVEDRDTESVLQFYFILEGEYFAVWSAYKTMKVFVQPLSSVPISKYLFCFKPSDMTPTCRLMKSDSPFFRWMRNKMRNSLVYYSNMETKLKVQPVFYKVL